MINKTIEHRDIVMVMDAKTAMNIKPPVLPEGYSFRFFESNADIEHWCRIEASVNEFDSYNRLGFFMTNKPIGYNGSYIKDFDRAIEVLGQVLRPEQVRNLYL